MVEKAENSIVVARCWGPDQVGIAHTFVSAAAAHKCQVQDMAQFLLEGSVLCTFVLSAPDGAEHLGALREELSRWAREKDTQLDFHFPDAAQLEEAAALGENEAVVAIVSTEAIRPGLLCAVDGVLGEHGCVVHEIEHRSDNKKENNGEYSKVSVRVGCPRGTSLATLMMGAPMASGELRAGLQKVAWAHNAEVTARWFDAMNRPNGKSLVVFGLSDVLCPYDVLDEVLKAAGVDLARVAEECKGLPQSEKNRKKMSYLAGHSADVLTQVMERLEFTPGAKLVCGALKRMGFTLAVLTNTGCRDAADHVKRQLDIDYVICRDMEVRDGVMTGAYGGDMNDITFRKADLLKLMADREKIKYRNVIVVGEPLKGMKEANARSVMETFGPMVHFSTDKHKDLTLVLYLLGFNGTEVGLLRRKRKCEVSPSDVPPQPDTRRFLLKVTSPSREPGQLSKIFAPLQHMSSDIEVPSVRLCSTQDGGMCLGLNLHVLREEPAAAIKDFFDGCQKHGFQVQDVARVSDAASPHPPDTAAGVWRHYYHNRFAVTLVQRPFISSGSLSAVLQALVSVEGNLVQMKKLSVRSMWAVLLVVNLPAGVDSSKVKRTFMDISREHGVDIAFQKDDVDRWMRRLIVFDMDSTLIQQVVMDELAKYAGVEEEMRAITAAAMRGELNFFDAFQARVSLLKGHNFEKLFRQVKAGLIFTPGAQKLCTTLRKLGFKMAVISGGFLPFAREVQRHLGLDYAFANTLEVDETTGCLTGCTSGPVVTPQRKRALLAHIANVEGCEVGQTIAVGDGAGDIPMLNAAGLGIAFCAKPKVQAETEFRINQKDLSTVLFLLGLSEFTVERLCAPEGEDAPI